MAAREIIDLGPMPLVNNLHATAAEAIAATRYPLRVLLEDDLTVHLDHPVPPDEMYKTYHYRSGVNAPYAEHCRGMWNAVKSANPRRIIDIGGNDGTLLKSIRAASGRELKLTNVDASRSMREDNERAGIEFVNSYWGDEDVGSAEVITSTNVFQHTADIEKFLAGIARHLDGLWLLECPYVLTTVATGQFDQIYHEHYYYWLVTPLVDLFARHGLTMLSVNEVDMHGGSLRIISTNKPVLDPRVYQPFIERERAFDFMRWGHEVRGRLALHRQQVARMREQGRVVGFGAAAKGCVWLNATHCHGALECVVDDTPSKQGRFVPGTSLEVVSRERAFTAPPETIIVLAHNFSDFIARSLRPAFAGSVVRMIPEFQHVPIRSESCCL